MFTCIVAVDQSNGIGKANTLPWPRLRGDIAFFKEMTIGAGLNAVIMGRKTWDSLPPKFRPLPERRNIVVSRSLTEIANAIVVNSFDDALVDAGHGTDNAFVIGGGEVYRLAITHQDCNRLYVTRIEGDYACDVFFPAIPETFVQTHVVDKHAKTDKSPAYVIECWIRK